MLVAGGAVHRAYDGGALQIGESSAFAPWRNWRSNSARGPLRLVQAGILAANPHNTQPWLFRVQNNTIEVFADRSRNLGTMDPYSREMHIGLGCAIENMSIAARAEGYDCQVRLADGKLDLVPTVKAPLPVATIKLQQRATKEDNPAGLYQAIALRHTDRAAYDTTRQLAPGLVTQLQKIGQSSEVGLVLLTSEADKQSFAQETLRATKAIVADKAMGADSHRWFRLTKQDMERHRDGVTLEGVGLSPLLLRLAKMLPESSVESSLQRWVDNTRDVHLATASVFGLLTVNDLYDQAAPAGFGNGCTCGPRPRD